MVENNRINKNDKVGFHYNTGDNKQIKLIGVVDEIIGEHAKVFVSGQYFGEYRVNVSKLIKVI